MAGDSLMLHVEVTSDDIAHGKKDRCGECPVALAIGRAVGVDPRKKVGVFPSRIYVNNLRRRWFEAACPPLVKHFINFFDNGFPVQPFTFDIALVPDESEVA